VRHHRPPDANTDGVPGVHVEAIMNGGVDAGQ
jgi:hypothetical protein